MWLKRQRERSFEKCYSDGKKNVFRMAKQLGKENRDVVGIGCVKDKEGKIVTEAAKILQVWRERRTSC